MADENRIRDLDIQILDRMLQDFLEEAREHLDQLNLNLIQLEERPDDEAAIDIIFRLVHTLKGSAAFAGLKTISDIARKMEEIIGFVRKETLKVAIPIIDAMFEGIDVITALVDQAASKDSSEVDVSRIQKKLDRILKDPASNPDEYDKPAADCTESEELLGIYKDSYNQLAALKHLVYSSIHLSDQESLAVMFSKQIDERMAPERNAIWLMEDDQRAAEIARDGKLVEKENRRVLEIQSSEVLKRVVQDQIVVWSSSLPEVSALMPTFESPTIFPIKAQPQAFGFMVLDPEESTEDEIYQFVGQFAAMILNVSKLHQRVNEQNKELDEMTGILFRQNTHLSSLYHVELEMMNVANSAELCRILVEAAVNDFEAAKAATFLIDEFSQEFIGISESGGLQGIDAVRFPVEKKEPIRQALDLGRIVSYVDYPEELHLGANILEDWIVVCLKGMERIHGVLIAVVSDEDIVDPISILSNYSGILLDNLMLTEKRRK